MRLTERTAQDSDLQCHFEYRERVRQRIISRGRETCFSAAPNGNSPFARLMPGTGQALDYDHRRELRSE